MLFQVLCDHAKFLFFSRRYRKFAQKNICGNQRNLRDILKISNDNTKQL
jgi:hypothetical protein